MSLENEIKKLTAAIQELTKAVESGTLASIPLQENPENEIAEKVVASVEATQPAETVEEATVAEPSAETQSEESEVKGSESEVTEVADSEPEDARDYSHADVMELAKTLNKSGVPAPKIKDVVKEFGVAKIADLEKDQLNDCYAKLQSLAK